MPIETFHLARTVVLVGMMGAGKTAVGRALARELGVEFRDSDEEMVRASTLSVAEIFAREGEAFFRRKETQVIRRLLDAPPMVLSVGGGTYLSASNRKLIEDKGTAVWLRADLDLLWARVRHKSTRPLLRTPDPRATLAEIYAQRVPVYALAGISVTARKCYSIAEMTGKVIAALLAHPEILTRTR